MTATSARDGGARPPVSLPRFASPLHDQRTAAILGVALGIAFGLCFLTGLVTWLIQHPPSWFVWPSRPAGLYRINQGLHVATGIAAIPLLLVKLWVVYPHFWSWPPLRNAAHGVERLLLLPLVGGSLFLLYTGVANIALWYPWPFSFPYAHYWAAWITIGGLVAHGAAKSHLVRAHVWPFRRRPAVVDPASASVGVSRAGGLDRRDLLLAAFGTSGLLTLATVGQTVGPLSALSVLAPRRPSIGPQGFPVNRTADGAGVLGALDSIASYRLVVEGDVDRVLRLSLDDLRSLPQHEAELPIACVEGWSATARWRGVRVRDLLDMAGASGTDRLRKVRVGSLQTRGSYGASDLHRPHALDRDTLLALDVNGEPLHPDHGFPLRLIAPNRPGVLQTKWVTQLVVQR